MVQQPAIAESKESQTGLTLIEILVVVAILGIVAVAAVPSFSPADTQRLELAAVKVADALRFARSEAIRTGNAHGVRVNHLTEKVVVYKVGLPATDPPTVHSVLYHPISKMVYDFDLTTLTRTSGTSIANTGAAFSFSGLGERMDVTFNSEGAPVFIVGAAVYQLSSGDIRIGNGMTEQIVSLQPMTGRVTVQ